MFHHTIILHGTQRRFCRSKYLLAHQQIPHPLSLHVPRTKTQPGKYRNLAGLVLYSLSIAFQSIFAVRFPHADTRLPSVRHRKSFLASSVFHHMGYQTKVPFYQNVPCLKVTRCCLIQVFAFLLRCQWFGKASGAEFQSIEQSAQHQINTG